jgi:glycosyltransferase involved in cell wall biosynthesis
MESKLTIIIPFLNEQYEVENTLQSIREHSSDKIEIILINDASDDGFDYREVAERHQTEYIENKERIGVAASRDLGVTLCRTPYFLFLDAHMRFYDKRWVQRIVNELEADKRALLCCQSKSLHLENGCLYELKEGITAYGACMEYIQAKGPVELVWNFREPANTEPLMTIPIVCVLGAGYACSKAYWQYLKGLDGLKLYGSDEACISMKVWLEGGACKLLKDVVIGHIYRQGNPPYTTDAKFRLFNRLFIVELLFPKHLKREIRLGMKTLYLPHLSESLLLLYANRGKIKALKTYSQKIFTRDFSFFEEMNDRYYPKEKNNKKKYKLVDGIETVLADILTKTEEKSVTNQGLMKGTTGILVFLYHYARFSKSEAIKAKADALLDDLLISIQADTPYSFYNGLSGIGWGIEYLVNQGFQEGDTNEILEEFDKKIMEINPLRICSINKDCGLGGIVQYLLARFYSIEKKEKPNPFDREYLDSLYNRIKTVFEQQDATCDSLDIFLDFMDYYEGNKELYPPVIYDVWNLHIPQNIPLQDMEPGLTGAAGVGLKLILDSSDKDKQ